MEEVLATIPSTSMWPLQSRILRVMLEDGLCRLLRRANGRGAGWH